MSKTASKTYHPQRSVLVAARERIAQVFDHFEHIAVSFSGGKDSTVLLHLALAEAEKRGRTVDVLFIDWEAQYQATIDHVQTMMQLPGVNPLWVCLPLSTNNATSFHEPMWTSWDPEKRDVWVRDIPDLPGVISDPSVFPFYRHGMTFEEFIPAFFQHLSETRGGEVASLIGLRASESLNRFRAVKREKQNFEGWKWSTRIKGGWNFYPIYDWEVNDIWTYHGDHDVPHNRIYDLMYLSGMSLHDMRIDEPFSEEARKHLDTYHLLEPDTWQKLVKRVSGANFGKMYGDTAMLGRLEHELPAGYDTWKDYALTLLGSMPPALRDHYERRIQVFIKWFQKHKNWEDLKDISTPEMEKSKKAGSWRNVAITLLQNDYFCKRLSFSVNKREQEKFQALKEKYQSL
ncbi:DUF3440 domain-containing protein [Deinococcus misasensis]|uniref:DUF3440 domain-containing protein n=1 Tax=Deinococcus misasensis TaxID=392413 RepID=UPI000553C9D3|nr:DUF3440 domain-containing protein [Deinococcus misasensis]